MKQLLIILSSFFILNAANAQAANGMWYGIGRVDVPGEHSNYLTEIIIQQKGNLVTGQFNYFFKEQYFEYKIKGKFDSKTRKLTFSSVPIVYYNSVTAAMGIECTMHGSFTLMTSKAETALIGKMVADEDYKYTCPPILLKLMHPNSIKPLFEMPEPDTDVSDTKSLADMLIAKADEAKKRKDSLDKIRTVVTPPVVKETPKVIKPEPIDTAALQQLKAFTNRKVIEEKFIEVDNNNLRFELYDNGDIDGDTMSLFFNKQIMVYKKELGIKPITINVTIDSVNVNELSLFAENLGKIPPNSALIIMYDGNAQTEFTVNSTLTTNGTIRIKKRKPKDNRYIN